MYWKLVRIYYFDKKESPVTIGRKKTLIQMDYSFFSRNQCTLEWQATNKEWVLYDGYKNKTSSYGTW